jgi:transposase
MDMMGRRSGQMAIVFVDIESLIPENHLLRKINQIISFDFIYDLLAPYYPATGRPSIDPVSMFKMLLVGYLYGIKSERRLEEEVRLNIAYRWFCGFELDDTIPDHSTFSKTRTRKWHQSDLFQKVFQEIVKQCIVNGLVDGKAMAADGSYIPANVSRESWIDVEIEVEQSMQSYLDSLDEELSKQPGFKKPPTRIIKKRRTTSQTDPDSGYINHGSKRGIGYLMEATVDCKHGILTGVDVYPANEKESLLVLRHLERQIKLGVPMNRLALDRGYETGAVHRGLELLGITGYIPAIRFSNPPEKYDFSYDPERDVFICPEGIPLTYHRLNCNKSTGKYLRCYQVDGNSCMRCPKRPDCFDKAGIRRRVLASSCYPAFYRGHQRVGSPAFLTMMRLRKIWAEGSFSVLKREHCISKIRKRGIPAATEECLLAAMALNLKRMLKAVPNKPKILFNWVGGLFFSPSFLLLSTGPTLDGTPYQNAFLIFKEYSFMLPDPPTSLAAQGMSGDFSVISCYPVLSGFRPFSGVCWKICWKNFRAVLVLDLKAHRLAVILEPTPTI